MKNQFIEKFDIKTFRDQSRALPIAVPDFQHIAPVVRAQTISIEARNLLEAYKPLLNTIDWESVMPGTPEAKAHYKLTAQVVTAMMLRNMSRIAPKQWAAEATLAGTDIPSYARQQLFTLLRAYPQLFAIQLFAVTPLNGPDGRAFFKSFKYNKAYAATAPNIADGDRTDDLTKFNKDFFKVAQGAQANKLKFSIDSVTVAVDSYRVVGDWTYEAEDDLSALYETDINSTLTGHMSEMMGWVTDRTLIAVAQGAVPAANKITWDSTNAAAYATYAPTEKQAYDQTLYNDGILPVINAIEAGRVYSLTPNWMIAGPKAALKLQQVKGFTAAKNGLTGLTVSTGMRDFGGFDALNLRVIIDPQYTTNKILFGRRPSTELDPAIHYLPYRALKTTSVLEDPEFGTMIKGVYTRFGVTDPVALAISNANASQLADVYGELTLSNLP